MFTFGYLFSRMSWLNKCFHRYFSQYLSLYEVFNVHSLRKAKPLEVSSKLLYQSMSKHFMALTESLSVIRSLNSLNPLITGKTSYSFLIWQPPAFPYRHQYSIIGRFRLNHRVRDVDGCFPKAHRHQKIVSASQIHQKLLRNFRSLSSFCLITEQWITFTRFP